ncbi:MAG: alpha/beta hydrolase [Bacilli bacterium]|nr:alpha/beta hydrolase [Bacilli bacterium]
MSAYIIDKIIRKFYRIDLKKTEKWLKDNKKNKDKYHIPYFLIFPRKMKTKKYEDMIYFEMFPKNNNKTILYMHGGGYINNFLVLHWSFLIKLSKKGGYGVVAPNYPLLPKYSYRQSNNKMLSFYKYYSDNHDMKDVVLMGDSAGGGFALSLLIQAKRLNMPLPGKVVLISPFVDVIGGNKKLSDKDAIVDYDAVQLIGKAWADGGDPKKPEISPLYGDLDGLPPIDIYVGTNEILYDDNIKLYKKLKSAGNEVQIHIGKNLGHVYPIYPLPCARSSIKSIKNFIDK